ncbi:aldehyde dehydrogenase family protein [Paraburkholderia xenovorans LB400]|uniref:Betaine-aldehyde dehydrogenase n=1 Tax=Paraburkholderia xenovorans (strain LB400) TaxID=266265 RepID=Q13GX2_PARXL|nr:aldehyde dehydrogenase family protein [Paraburkholderia xenovorans]ABE36667.1 Betaine-aldehyde dehydrogenase [Paraburkholderia xenovorans LB400]AIP34638.1 aldehyde dehydrogenase family protein [Paraburkholderia xenovorans LB400]
MNDFSLLIDGQLVAGDHTIPVLNPATGKVAASAPAASVQQLERAITAANRAFAGWRDTPFAERRAIVLKIIDIIAANQGELSRLLTLEQGKPLAAAAGEVSATIDYFRYFTTLSLAPEVRQDNETRYVEVRRDPLGVVAAIIPWNFPLLLAAFKLPAALLAGNTVVLKPAPTTPLATLHLGRLIAGAVPAGVVNIVSGGDELGPVLTSHPGIRKVSFTGSTETGKKVMASAATHLARVTLELGGNDPAILLDKVDLEHTATAIFASAFGNSGQVCRAIKRVYVPRPIYEPFCAALAERARAAVVGDGLTDGVQFGPVQNAAQFERLKELHADAQQRGTVMPGGGPVKGPGYFFRPTIVKDIASDSRLVVEEQFGPILPVIAYDELEEAVEMANNSQYGLAASVWSTDSQAAFAVADRIVAGTVWINKHTDRMPDLPIAGARQSGMGVELGEEGLHEFTQIKIVNLSKAA